MGCAGLILGQCAARGLDTIPFANEKNFSETANEITDVEESSVFFGFGKHPSTIHLPP